jgi:hypothetical protein
MITLQIKRGLSADLPSSAPQGELYYATDTNILYIGTGTGIVELNNGVNLTVSETDVNVLNFPATQTVSGSVSVSNLPSTQPVSGTISINAVPAGSNLIGQVEVSDGTNVLGTSVHPVKTDPTGTTTQPVSGTVAVSNLPATQPVSGSVSVTNLPATQPVSATSLPLPSGAATSAKQPALGTAGAASPDVISVQGVASMTPIKVDGSGVTQPVSGTVGATQSGTWVVQPGNTPNTTAWKVDGSAVTQPVSAAGLPLPTGASTAAKQPAIGTAGTPSTDVITIQGTASMTAIKTDGSATTQPVSGTVTANAGTGTLATKTVPQTSGGMPLPFSASVNATKQQVKGSAGQVYGYHILNNTAAIAYMQVFDKASASVTVGTTTPDYVIPLPASFGATLEISTGVAHANGITVACTTTRTGSTGAICDVVVFFN